jgi:hypothetical protein
VPFAIAVSPLIYCPRKCGSLALSVQDRVTGQKEQWVDNGNVASIKCNLDLHKSSIFRQLEFVKLNINGKID